jgi:hypothetical protein
MITDISKEILKPIETINLIEILNWCSDYNRYNKYPCNIFKRFLIAQYQIHQGMDWKDMGLNKYESYAAALLNFGMVCQLLELPIEQYIESDLSFPDHYRIENECYHLLRYISLASQQLIYGDPENKTKRKSRFNKNKMTKSMGHIIYILARLIPEELRSKSIYQSSLILTGGL